MSESEQNRLEVILRAPQALRAEEEPWLDSVYVPPDAIDMYTGARSMIVFGRNGSGRTALRLEIARRAALMAGQNILFVHWLPEAPGEALTGNQLAKYAMRQLIGCWIETLFVNLAQQPQRMGQLPVHLRAGLSFLFQEYLPIDPLFYLLSRSHELPDAGVEEMQRLLAIQATRLLRPEATTQTILNLIAAMLQQAGYTATWVMVDGLEKWQRGLRVQNRDMLGAMLDTLNYFDRKDIVFKVFALDEFVGLYRSLGGLDRYRLYPYTLDWTEEQLLRMVDQHIARLVPGIEVHLTGLCEDRTLLDWLHINAGQNPRWWLLLSRPFFAAFLKANLASGSHGPLSADECQKIATENPPALHIHYDTREVLLGERAAKLTPSSLNVLRYLYQNSQRVCKREEIYYLGVCGLSSIPERGEPHWETEDGWTGRLDTILWRLRKEIEPNPSNPVYLDTIRGQGLMLRNAWL
jgi:hypothetical protein